MRLAVSKGTRRPFAILAWVLVPLTALALGAGVWQSDQAAAATLAQYQWAIHIIGETATLQSVGRNVKPPTDLVVDTSSNSFLVGCGEDVGMVGCWVDHADTGTVTEEIVKAIVAAGLPRPTTSCASSGLRCDIVAELSGGELRFTLIWPGLRVADEMNRPYPGNTRVGAWKSEVEAFVTPGDVFSRAFDPPSAH
jgi:hypothetical protein